jgi:NitT/TauT family transport system ATP-binding protein
VAADGGTLDRSVSVDADVRLTDVSVRGRVESVSLSVPRGRRVALLGRNGGGKSTILRVAAGLVTPDHGSADVSGPIGYVPQDVRASLLPWFRVDDNVLLGVPERRRAEALEHALSIVPLARELLKRYPYQLSGGEQQMVTVARALVRAPRVLLLDEPFSALDLAARVALRDALTGSCVARGTTALLVTHELEDAVAFADQAIVLAGRPPRVAYDGPLHASTRDRIEQLVVDDRRGGIA